jgi:predicted Zn-dependent protease
MGRPDQAVPLLRRVFDEDRTRRRTSGYQLGMALGKIGRQEEADRVLAEVRRLQDVELFTDAVKSQPNNLDLNVRLAESLLRDGHTADGLRMLNEVLAQDPNHRGAHWALAAHYDRQGQADRAAEHRRRAGQN